MTGGTQPANLLTQCDPSTPYAGEVWVEAQPVGREFGAPPEIEDATIARAARDNPDLPRSFVADTLHVLAEAAQRDDKYGLP
jgi:hypothetical protein